jgi:hypothetical protein
MRILLWLEQFAERNSEILHRFVHNLVAKGTLPLAGACGLLLLTACSTALVPLRPVGPNPLSVKSPNPNGELEVFSSVEQKSDDQNQGSDGGPIWYQHTDYELYTADGKHLRHIDNVVGHYDETPEPVALPPGNYLVDAQAKGYFWVQVPVTIQSGRTTRVHLDNAWKPAGSQEAGLVLLPNGVPVGWRVDTNKYISMN